jgi:hypothetical protein
MLSQVQVMKAVKALRKWLTRMARSPTITALQSQFNPYQDELDKDNGAIPCAFCALSFPDEDEVISHMIAVYPRMSG